jgi:hypothetical protein
MIKNIPGFSRIGKPVYPEYRDDLHLRGRELIRLWACRWRSGWMPAARRRR